ncbi:MAG: DUF4270 family protein [Chitinophagia bacterium]|nr:DUF4270 family protein [Chitinophagia bacterium]
MTHIHCLHKITELFILKYLIPTTTYLLVAIAIIWLGLAGCKENTLINSSIVPNNDSTSLQSITLGCITHSFFDKDVVTSVNISGINVNQAVGCMQDSFFGGTVASTYFQLLNPNIGAAPFDTTYHFDSAFLFIPYSGFSYGDTSDYNATQTYQVYTPLDTLGYSTYYYPDAYKTMDMTNPLSDPITVNVHNLADSVTINGKKYSPGLRLKLKVLPTLSKINHALFYSQNADNKIQAFIDDFKGICLRPADTRSTGKVIPYFRLNGSTLYEEAAIVLHYHRIGDADTVLEYFHGRSYCAHFNSITKSYSRSPVNALYTSTQVNDSIVAIQNMPGSSIDVVIPDINKIPKNAVINKVELQISFLPSYNNTKYALPQQLFVTGIGNGTYPAGIPAGSKYDIEDRKPITSLSPYSILDGNSHALGSPAITTYTIGIPREYMASLAAQNNSLHLQVHGSQVYYGALRMLAAGGSYSNPRYQTKLFIVYSTIK